VNPERWRQIDRILGDALRHSAAELDGFLDRACGEDRELDAEVRELWAAAGDAECFLADPLDRSEVAQWLAAAICETERCVGPYRLLRVIGHGGMSTVYLAVRDGEQPPRRVAVKFIQRGFKSAEVLRRFDHERRILAQLDHPNICRLHDGGVTGDDRPFLVMEFIEGEPIDRYCDRHRLGIDGRLELFRELCSAVGYVHRNQLVHRDLKPANVLVTREGRVKLLDFGIAKLLEPGRFLPNPQASRSKVRVLTPGYASPEQMRGEAITPASDIYSLGILLFELLSGTSPYRLSSPLFREIERVVCEQEAEKLSIAVDRIANPVRAEEVSRVRGSDPRTLRRRLAGDLETIVAMALRKKPEQRYGSVEELSDDLRRHLLGQPILARPNRFGYQVLRRLRRWVSAGGAVVSS